MLGSVGALLGAGVACGLVLVWMAVASEQERRRRRPGRWAALLAAAGWHGASPSTLGAACAASALGATLVVGVVSRTAPVAVVFGVMAAYLPIAVVSGRARRRQRDLAEVWPEAIDDLASAVRAGLSLPEALAGLATRGPEPLRDAFRRFAIDYQTTGRFADCLDRLKLRLADPVGDRVVEGLRVAREVGSGELGRLLRSLSGYLRDDLRTRSELEARQSWAVNGARLAVGAPWAVLLFMSFQPEVIHRYQSGAGTVVLATAAGVCVVAYRVMMRIGRLPAERRILEGRL